MASSQAVQAENAYFSSNPPPRQLDAHTKQAKAFIDHHAEAGHRVVLITSGGTTVPLEKNTVRFIDNFSAGTRGATSAEYFLAAGYAVIFLHREFSLQPYSRHYTHAKDCFLDFLSEDKDGKVCVREGEGNRIVQVLRQYQSAKDRNMLLMLPFVTIGDYLHELRAIARLMAPLGPSGLLYLAAAVSDFFVPPERMSEHKIQSTDVAKKFEQQQAPPPAATEPIVQNKQQQQQQQEHHHQQQDEDEAFDNFDATTRVPRSKRLVVDLDPVPKFLENLVGNGKEDSPGWAPEGMIVSFKLETDPAILVYKARTSLDRYKHHLVVGNLLTTRKWEVVFVSPHHDDHWLRVARTQGWGDAEGRPLRTDELPKDEDPESEIEALIIPAVAELHKEHISRKNGQSSSK